VSTDDAAADARHERLFAAHYLPVMRLCMRRLGDVDDAEDAVQEVFRRAVQHRADLRDDPLPWLITVAKHVCLDELRRRASGRATLERSAATDAGDGDSPERTVVGHLFVRELLGRLTPAERRVMAARVYRGSSATDTAELLGVSSSTTRVLLARARQKLRAYLEDGQTTLAALPLLLTRSLHSVRRRLLSRPWTGDGRIALALPAALVFTVATSPAVAPRNAPRVDGPPLAQVQPESGDARLGADASRSGAEGGGVQGSALTEMEPPGGLDAPHETVQPGRLPDIAAPGVHMTYPQDIEPSPDYAQDHTLLMSAASRFCVTDVNCNYLYRSTDGGASWTAVHTVGFDAYQLILPPASYSSTRFYAMGGAGLQTTSDGVHFLPVVSTIPDTFAAAAPASTNLNVVVTNTALWRVPNMAPILISTFSDPTGSADGPPAFIHTATGDVMLLPFSVTEVPTDPPAEVLRCTPTCGDPVALPFTNGSVSIVPSPDQADDHVVFAASPAGLAVSYDDGARFASLTTTEPVSKLLVTEHAGSRRLVALVGLDPGAPEYSDDDGRTWHSLHLPRQAVGGTLATLTAIDGQHLIATISENHDSNYIDYLCSSDGASWSTCGSQAGP
jgi:RNA polymerase sigma-70 factor (ECF subfamily)